MGWCLGGRAASALASARPPGLRCAVSFHGVVDPGVLRLDPKEDRVAGPAPRVLFLHGGADPFVPAASLEATVKNLKRLDMPVEVEVYDGVRHGFTNPAQALNENPAFGYDDDAARDAWARAEVHLGTGLGKG